MHGCTQLVLGWVYVPSEMGRSLVSFTFILGQLAPRGLAVCIALARAVSAIVSSLGLVELLGGCRAFT